MPRKKKTPVTNDILVVGVLDRSGSMAGCLQGAVEGWNDYLKDLKADENGETVVWLTGFDTIVEDWETGTPVKDVPYLKMSGNEYPAFVPRGMTALYDAIATSIVNADKYLKSIGRDGKSENPMKVLHVTLTDGGENASSEYSLHKDGAARLQALTKKYEKQGNWTFVFLGADQDAWANAEPIGYASTNVAYYSATMDSNAAVSNTLSAVTRSRKASPVMASAMAFSDAGASTDLTDTALSSKA